MLLSTQQINNMLAQTKELVNVIKPDEIDSLDYAVRQLKSVMELQQLTVDCLYEYHKALDTIVTMHEVEKAMNK